MKLLLVGGLAAALFAQTPSFEVASVKPSPPDADAMIMRAPAPGGLRVSGARLKDLVALAYNIRTFQISSGPEWAGTARFDIEARARTSEADVTPEDRRNAPERLRSLLADRFQLTFHRETREQPMYALIVAKGGPKFKESVSGKNFIRNYRGSLKGEATTIAMLAVNVSYEVGRQVIDKTGLSGKYDFDLKWTPGLPSATPNAEEVSMFTALTEQLGLRLVAQKGPVEMLVIDRAEKPSEN